ncbi:MAG TPA: hypothetical protein VEI97_05740 [bacterium]|nr:hypothetical protein [bacterium]
MKTKPEQWARITQRARWYELPQRKIGWEAVAGLTVACVGLMMMVLQFILVLPPPLFVWGLIAFLAGSGLFAYAERTAIGRAAWKSRRDYLIEVRGKTHRCLHLEGDLPTHLRDSRQARCVYYDRSFQHAPLCVYCDAYSPLGHLVPEAIANSPGGTVEGQAFAGTAPGEVVV